MIRSKKLKILMMSAEVAPFAKVGGLADVAGSLPIALKELGHDIRMIMPLYKTIDREKFKLKKIYEDFEVPSGDNFTKIDIWKTNLPGTRIPVYFIDSPRYFKFNSVYTSHGDSDRFLFYSLASLYSTPIINFIPDVIHCHDSHTAMVPDIIKASNFEFLKEIKTVYTIHNFKYQGKTGLETLSTGNLSVNSLKSITKDAQDGDINFTVQGIINADIINTVSEKYSGEIMTPYYGHHLDNIIKKRKEDVYGIINGIDIKRFNPLTDKDIVKRFSVKTVDKKTENKIALQKRLGLPVGKDIPLVAMTTRLVWQKGIELITEKYSKLKCQFVFLGTGHGDYEKYLTKLARKYPEKFSANIIFDVGLAQQIYASSDMFLMPSRFEPCGLGQMIAMRYGSLPVVRATGGLDDTVDEKVGFKFKKFQENALFETLRQALYVYYSEPKKWRRMQINAMKKDFSWKTSAKKYVTIYKRAINK